MTILFIWGVIAMAGTPGGVYPAYGWKALSEHSSPVACEAAIHALGLSPKIARCVPK